MCVTFVVCSVAIIVVERNLLKKDATLLLNVKCIEKKHHYIFLLTSVPECL
jgi:hypothetical protein